MRRAADGRRRQCLIIANLPHLHAAQRCRRRGAEILHQLLHAGHSGRTGHEDVDLPFAVVAVLPVERIELIEQRLPLGFDARRQFGHQQARRWAVLIAHILPDQEAVRLFRAQQELVLPPQIDLLGDPLEADVDVVARLHAKTFADSPHQRRGDERRYEEMILAKRAGFLPLLADVIGHQGTQLVAGEGAPGTGAVLAARRGAAHSVAVGIGRQDQVGLGLLRPLDDGVEDDRIFGIRNMPRHIRKIAAWLAVRGKHLDLAESVCP